MPGSCRITMPKVSGLRTVITEYQRQSLSMTLRKDFLFPRVFMMRSSRLLCVMKIIPAGYMYEFGAGVYQDFGLAFFWLHMAARQGEVASQCGIAAMYEYGLGVSRDLSESAKLYRKATDQGNKYAQYHLGRMIIWAECTLTAMALSVITRRQKNVLRRHSRRDTWKRKLTWATFTRTDSVSARILITL